MFRVWAARVARPPPERAPPKGPGRASFFPQDDEFVPRNQHINLRVAQLPPTRASPKDPGHLKKRLNNTSSDYSKYRVLGFLQDITLRSSPEIFLNTTLESLDLRLNELPHKAQVAPLIGPRVDICLGTYGDPTWVGVTSERGTPVFQKSTLESLDLRLNEAPQKAKVRPHFDPKLTDLYRRPNISTRIRTTRLSAKNSLSLERSSHPYKRSRQRP